MTVTEACENKIRGSSRAAAPGTATAGLPMIGVGPSKHEAGGAGFERRPLCPRNRDYSGRGTFGQLMLTR